MNTQRKRIAIAGTLVASAAAVLLASASSRSHLGSDIALRNLRASKADVTWVTHRGLLEGNQIQLPADQCYHSVWIGDNWTGDNRGLAWLRDIPRLEWLRIQDAPRVNDDGLAEIGMLPDLEELYLERLGVSDRGVGFLRAMPRLRVLVMGQMPITDDGLRSLAGMTNLESVSLAAMEGIGDKSLLALEHLPRLRELVLAETKVTDAGLMHLGHGIEVLNLYGTQITDDGIKWLKPLDKLKVLDLTGTRVSDKAFAYLVQLPNLGTIYLGNTAVTPGGVAAFLRACGPSRPIRINGFAEK